MQKKILYFDTETTGTDPRVHGIVQLSGIVEIDGEVKETFNLKIRPFKSDMIDPEALAIHGMKQAEIETFPEPREQYVALNQILVKYVNRYDRNDKFTPAGYNVRFDMEMLAAFFRKNGDQYFGSILNWKMIDGLPLMHYLEYLGMVSLPDYKLSTVCAHFGIEIKAHDAMSDITATREVIGKISEMLLSGKVEKFECLEHGSVKPVPACSVCLERNPGSDSF